MSYDVSLMADTGGEPVEVWQRNHTSNTSRMWKAAGCDIAAFDGCSGAALSSAAYEALTLLALDPETYRQFEPGNGWGTLESTKDFLRAIAEAGKKYPRTTVRVWR